MGQRWVQRVAGIRPSRAAGFLALAGLLAVGAAAGGQAGGEAAVSDLLAGRVAWKVGPALLTPQDSAADHHYSIKDPTIARYGDKWHLFCTIRGEKRSHLIEYITFADWAEADKAPRRALRVTDGYFCAPQVFYFTPQKKWYLIYQTSDKSRKPALQPAWSATQTIENPDSWSKPTLLFAEPPKVKMWIDFWVICNEERAFLFFTSLDGNMWRSETALGDFPGGWSQPVLALHADIFEAGHTYRLKGLGKYLTVVEAQAGGRRYYKAYLADRLDGAWRPRAATVEKPFAGPANVRDTGSHWTDSFSHGELLRAGYDEKLEVDPANLQLLFQGVTDAGMAGKPYGQIPWSLGLLEADRGRE